jgi:quinol-cytochrome oxidoreductase complex cytochrome b subunit
MDIDKYVSMMNENKLFVGLMVVVVAVGGRFIIEELNESQKQIIHNTWVRRLFVFGVCFMATRDICISSIITMIFIIIVSEFTNTGEHKYISIEEDKLQRKHTEKQIIIEQISNQLQKLQNN